MDGIKEWMEEKGEGKKTIIGGDFNTRRRGMGSKEG
jgi:hypothetical protein